MNGHEIVMVVSRSLPPGTCLPDGLQVVTFPQTNFHRPYGGLESKPTAMKFISPAWHALDSWNPLSFGAAMTILKDLKPDIVHTNCLAGLSVAVWSAAVRLGIPIVHTLRDFYLVCAKANRWRGDVSCVKTCADCRVLSAPKILATGAVHSFVGISQFILDLHIRGGAVSALKQNHVVFNPVRQQEEAVYELVAPAGNRIVLGFLGRLHPTKGIELLAESVIASGRSDMELLIAGTGKWDYSEELSERFASSRIKFLGQVKPSSFFESIDCLVVPSLWSEPFGRVVAEAFASGIPVVASNTGSLPELVQPGVNGFLFDPKREALTALLRELDSMTLHSMRGACVRSGRLFASDVITSQYERIFHEVLMRSKNKLTDLRRHS